MTVMGMNLMDVKRAQMNVTQMEITSTSGSKIYPEVNYPAKVSAVLAPYNVSVVMINVSQPCLAHNGTGMSCVTPALQLPSKEDFGPISANYRFGFTFVGYEEYEEYEEIERDTNDTSSFSIEIKIMELPTVEEQHWLNYDATKGETLDFKVRKAIIFCRHGNTKSFCFLSLSYQIEWGAFQDQAQVNVGGVECSIVERFDNLIQFYPPDENRVLTSGCHALADSYSIDVRDFKACRSLCVSNLSLLRFELVIPSGRLAV
eukprot:GHVO01030257.1.p1 GENE.GHVO01030257.1~~GHVO01030257.1.p1  ORF type:complete len:260 (-),score=12.83 GHVO01030257.1:303-1082(-)